MCWKYGVSVLPGHARQTGKWALETKFFYPLINPEPSEYHPIPSLATGLCRCPSVPDLGSRIRGGQRPWWQYPGSLWLSPGPPTVHCLSRASPKRSRRSWWMRTATPCPETWYRRRRYPTMTRTGVRGQLVQRGGPTQDL